MQLSAIFVDDGWEIREMRYGLDLAAVLISTTGPVSLPPSPWENRNWQSLKGSLLGMNLVNKNVKESSLK